MCSSDLDNDTTLGWWRTLPADARRRFCGYTGYACAADAGRELPGEMIRIVLQGPARTAVVAMQDWLGLGGAARMNTPGKGSGQWRWRMLSDALGTLDPATIRGLIDASARA